MDPVREAPLHADLLMPSLDAGTPEVFQAVNRPCEGLALERVIEGLQRAVQQFTGDTWLEVMLVKGVNDSEAELRALAAAIEEIQPTEVQINTVVRPVLGGGAERLSDDELLHAQQILGPRAQVIPSAWEHGAPEGSETTRRSELPLRRRQVLALVSYRPCTLQDVAHGLDMHPNEAIKYVHHLLAESVIRAEVRDGETYYVRADVGK